ncbi:MAG: SRPBCC domain-containing protein [Maioricimonas sp. JB045]
MPVRIGPAGRRSVSAEVEVPGTPEVVWKAVATGEGLSSWFVPSTCDERVGGMVRNEFGPGMESVGTIREWNPPWHFVVETEEGPGTITTEWSVEIHPGRTCGVRVVHEWVADNDAWNEQFEEYAYGWQSFFRILTLSLQHFAGEPSAGFQLLACSNTSQLKTWHALMQRLNIRDGRSHVTPTPGAPPLLGQIERRGTDEYPELLLRLDRPGRGLAHLFVMPMGEQMLVSVRFYLYGDGVAQTARHAREEWSDWLARQFPQHDGP